MRPLAWIARLGLFAVGFGIGLSQPKTPSTPQPLVIEIHVKISETLPIPASVPPSVTPFEPPSCVELDGSLCERRL